MLTRGKLICSKNSIAHTKIIWTLLECDNFQGYSYSKMVSFERSKDCRRSQRRIRSPLNISDEAFVKVEPERHQVDL